MTTNDDPSMTQMTPKIVGYLEPQIGEHRMAYQDFDNLPLTMAPLRQQLTDGSIRTLDDLLTLILALGARAGRSGFDAAAEFVHAMLAIPDLDNSEITRLSDLADVLGYDGDE